LPEGFLQAQKTASGEAVLLIVSTLCVGTIGTDTSLALRIEIIQHPVHRQFTQHHGLLNTEQGVALRAAQLPGEIAQHDAGGRQ
jgi:hypothetical protein